MDRTIFPDNQFLDFHTHSPRYTDRKDVMEIVSIHLGKDRPHQYFTIGMHPWWTEQPISSTERQQLERLLGDPFCLGMGEMGLDNLKGPVITMQMEVFRSLLRVAQDLDRPVVIHCVRAVDQLVKIRKEFPSIRRWCIHGYGRHAILAKQLIDQGFYLSLMPGLPPTKCEELFRVLPSDRWFLETDSMPNVSIEEIYLQAAKILGIGIPELCQQMNSNARTFFEV